MPSGADRHRILLDGDALAAQLEAWLKRSTADPATDDRERLTVSRLEELRAPRGRLIDAYQTGALDLPDFRSRKEAIEERILSVEHELAELRSRASRRELAARQVLSAAALAAELRNRLAESDFSTKQAILRLVVDKVVVHEQHLEVHLALPHLALPVSGVSNCCQSTAFRGTRRT